MNLVRPLFYAVIIYFVAIVSANGQSLNTLRELGQCSEKDIGSLPLYYNLLTKYCVTTYQVSDSSSERYFKQKIGEMMSSKDQKYKDVAWQIREAYSISDYKDIFFFSISRPIHNVDPPPEILFDVAFNQTQSRMYLLNGISIDDIDQLFSTEELSLNTDSQILHFCWLSTLLRHPAFNIRFISSIEELLTEAISTEPVFFNLENVIQYEKIKIEMPSIIKNEGIIKATFTMALEDEIREVSISIKNNKIIDYRDNKIAETLEWYGKDRLRSY